MFGPVITTEAHLTYAGAKLHSNNTAEFLCITEALSFFGPKGPCSSDSQVCIFYDSKHAASICWRTIQSRVNVPLGLISQRLLLQVIIKVLNHCAAHQQSCAEARERMCRPMLPPLGHTVSFQIGTYTLVGFTLPLALLLCLLHVVTLMKPCRWLRNARTAHNACSTTKSQKRYVSRRVSLRSSVFRLPFWFSICSLFCAVWLSRCRRIFFQWKVLVGICRRQHVEPCVGAALSRACWRSHGGICC